MADKPREAATCKAVRPSASLARGLWQVWRRPRQACSHPMARADLTPTWRHRPRRPRHPRRRRRPALTPPPAPTPPLMPVPWTAPILWATQTIGLRRS